MSPTRGRNNRLLNIAAIVSLLILVVSGTLLVIDLWDSRSAIFQSEDPTGLSPVMEYDGRDYVLKEEIETFLVIGLDKFGESSNDNQTTEVMQADFVMLLVIDNRNMTCAAIHLNRDTMADVNQLDVAGKKMYTVNQQLALAHSQGNGREVSCRNVADTVSGLLYDVRVDHYVSVTMDSVSIYNDLAGGVTLEVLDDFTGVDETLIKGETVTLRGEHALNYIRSRKGLDDATNINRMERQRQYLDALYRKTLECKESDDKFVVNATLEMAQYMVSDCSSTKLQTFFEKVTEYEFLGIRDIQGTSVKGENHMEFYPEVDSMKKVIIELFYEEKK